MDKLEGETDPPGSNRLPNDDEERDAVKGDREHVSARFKNHDEDVRPSRIIPSADPSRTREDTFDRYADRTANLHERSCRKASDKSHTLKGEGKFYSIYSSDDLSQLESLAFPLIEELGQSWSSNPTSLRDPSRTTVGLMSSGTTHLYDDLTVHENLRFVRRLCGGPKSQVQQRIQVLSEILQLPNEHYKIRSLQTSERDRVTLAAVLMHSPHLLLIRNPTKEQDRSMKERILDLLRTLGREQEVAVLLFTDDPEEATQADDVSIVVNGCLMARDSPDRLLAEFQCKTLGGVFEALHTKGECAVVEQLDILEDVCVITATSALETEKKTAPKYEAPSAVKHTVNSEKNPLGSMGEAPQRDVHSVSWYRIFLLLMSQLITFKRFDFVLPLVLWGLSLSMSALAIVEKCPNSFRPELPVALVKSNSTSSLVDSFLDSLAIGYLPFVSSPNDTSLQRPYDDLDEALASLERGETCAVMRVGRNFSSAPHYHFVLRSRADEEHALNESVLDIDVDAKSQEIRFVLQRAIVLAAKKLRLRIKEATNGSCAEMESRFEEPVFGSRSIGHFEFLAPSVFIYTTLAIAVMLAEVETIHATTSIIRALFTTVCVKSREIAISDFFYLLCVLSVQIGAILFCMFLLNWNDLLPLNGSIVLATILIYMQGLLGIAVGLTITLLAILVFGKWVIIFQFSMAIRAIFVFWAAFGPRFWSARIVRVINYYILPTTSTESLRNILYRGWGLDDDDVLGAFIGLAARTVVFSLFATCLIKLLHFAGRSHVQASIQYFWPDADILAHGGTVVKFAENRFLIQKSRLG